MAPAARTGSKTVDMDAAGERWELLSTSPFVELIGPVYALSAPDAVFRVVIGAQMINTMGRMHGGYASALVDVCAGQGIKRMLGDGRTLVTVSTNLDFIGAAALGDRVDIVVTADRVTASIVFASCELSVRGESVVRASVVFASRDKASAAPG